MKYHGEVITEDEARSRFQQMKAAYDALSDKKKRQVYDALGDAGMDFVINPSHAWDPHVLLGNLAKSSVGDRAKLMMLVLLFFGLLLVQPILICAKVDQMLKEEGGALVESAWAAIFTPFWIYSVGFSVMLVVGKAWLVLVQWLAFVIGVLLLTLKWDGVITADYAAVFIPFYIWMTLRWLGASKEMNDTRTDMSKMVTIDYIEKYILNEIKQDENGNDIEGQMHRTYNDLNEEERDELNESYIIVHVPPKTAAPGEEAEQTMEADLDQIERSPEYQETLSQHREAYKSIQRIILPEIPFIILIIIQLDMNKNWNWGIVFIPVWINMFMECCGGCYGFFCTSALAHIEVQESMAAHFARHKGEHGAENEENVAKEETNEETEAKTDFDKVKEDVEEGKGRDSKPVGKANSEETAETAKEGESKTDVDTAVAVDSPTVEKDASAEFPEEATKPVNDVDDDDEFIRNMFSMDEETFQYYQQAEQEAESKATEAQSKAIASFCNIMFQIIFAVLFVVKLNQVYDEREEIPEVEGTDSFSTFWIIFPLLLFAGCTICCCFCAIFCAAEVDTHMMHSDKAEEEANGEEAHADFPEAAVVVEPPKEKEIDIEQTSTSEGMELDISGQVPIKEEAATPVPPEKKESEMDDLD